MDVGTGDGRYVLDMAAAHPRVAWIGVDADAAGMRESSHRAVRRLRLDNVLFVASDAARFLEAVAGRVDELTVHFPWGSLLSGALGADAPLASTLACAVRTGGTLRIVTSTSARDARGTLTIDPDRVTGAFEGCGLTTVAARHAVAAEIAATRSSWAKRLRQTHDRQTWLFAFRRDPPRLV